MKRLAPDIAEYDVGYFPVLEDYHLLPGERPSRLLRQMAKEKGALCFYRRGSLVFRTLADLMKGEAVCYEYDNPLSPNQIIHFARENASSIISDRVDRRVVGWDMVKGLVKAGKKTDEPPEFVSVANLQTMHNLTSIPYPAIDFTTLGNGALMPGIPVDIKWHTSRIDSPIDESLPAKVLINVAAHFYSGQKLFTRIKGVTEAPEK